tara:strand:+ start:498 stop:761 length:264 start_codon:yes stop_codon:yes gene_type:complete
MAAQGKKIFVVAAKRTAFGAFGGSFKGISATDLAVHATKVLVKSHLIMITGSVRTLIFVFFQAALAAGNVDPSVVNSVVVGNVHGLV